LPVQPARPVFLLDRFQNASRPAGQKGQHMSQFTIPGREIRLGILGLGDRGLPQAQLLAAMPDVRIEALCDPRATRLARAQEVLKEAFGLRPAAYAVAEQLLDHPGLEAVVVMTSWETHIPLAIQALRRGLVPALEVGGASSLTECWQLVEASEQTGLPVMLLENCCYGREEMAVLNMVRQGLFGQLVHCRGAYEHDLREEIGRGDQTGHYRQRHFLNRNADLYPTHGLGPIASCLGLGRGNRMVSLASFASQAAGLSGWLRAHRQDAPALVNARPRCGDVVTTLITCAQGQTILLNHDCTLPRAYSRGGRVQGTKGIWMEDNRSIYIEGRTPDLPGHWTHVWESDEPYMREYEHPLWRAYAADGVKAGHGGMDYLVLRAFIEALQQGTPFPIDVYDAVAWMSVTALSEQSIASGGQVVAMPDFTNGRWLSPRAEAQGKYALHGW